MRMSRFCFCMIIALLWEVQGLAAQDKILVAGSGNPAISLVDKQTGKVEWRHALEKGEECNSVALTPEGNILYSYKKGAKTVNWAHEVVWDYEVTAAQELQSATLLPDGGILLGICGNPALFVEVDKEGKETHRVAFDLGIAKPHSQFRQVFRLRNGNYLVPLMSARKVMEISRDGSLVKEYEVGGKVLSSLEMSDGNWLLPCGDDHCYVVMDGETGAKVKKVTSVDVTGGAFWFVAQVIELQNKHLLVCNWDGHTKGEVVDVPQLMELDEKGKVVWSLRDKQNVGKVSAAYYIDKQKWLKLGFK